MDNPHVRWRTERAREFAKRLVAYENIEAIVVGGSVARGYADEYSDLEIINFWSTLPNDTTRNRIVDDLQGRFLFGYDGPAREDQLIIHGLQVDLWHISVSHQESTIDRVLNHYQSDLGSLNAMDTVRNCIPLFGEKLVKSWKDQAAQYPQQLVEKIVSEHTESFRVDYLMQFEDRNNPTGFYSQLSFLQQEAFLVLLALNQMYFPTFKWLYVTLEKMQLKPVSIAGRFQQAYEVPHDSAISGTRQILEEITQLVEDQLPDYDSKPVRRRLRYRKSSNVEPHIR
jgi:predicted nucleotidyltransferase